MLLFVQWHLNCFEHIITDDREEVNERNAGTAVLFVSYCKLFANLVKVCSIVQTFVDFDKSLQYNSAGGDDNDHKKPLPGLDISVCGQ